MSEFANIKLDLIEPSLTNPRKTFNPAKLAELANSIKVSGVHQPILVRPLPGSRVADTARGVQYELVCGERRLRASQDAGVATIPAMVRALTDAEVLEIQIVENLQRDDLTPLEEAEGYQALMDHADITADHVADKISKSRSYVYTRLKLLDLCPEARGALRDGTIDASRAVLVARIPDHKLQIKAMKEIAEGVGYYAGEREPMSYRKAAAHLQQNYMLKLADAKFSIKDESLVAASGACSTCPKRTGHNPDLFADVKSADVCIDPACFHKKEDAHAAAQVAAAKAKGQTVIAGKEAQELALPNYGSTKFKGYKRLDSAEDSPTDVPLRKIIGEQMKADGIKPVMISDPNKKGQMVECLPNEVAGRLLKAVEGQAAAAKVVTKEVKALVDEKRLKAEAKAKAQYEKEWRTDLRNDAWSAMRDDASIQAFDTEVHRYLVKQAANSLSTDDAAAICTLLNLGKVSPTAALIDFAKETPDPAMLHLLIIMQKGCDPHDHSYGGRIPNEGLMLVAGNVFGSELQRTIKDIKAEAMDRIMPKPAKKADVATAPAARQKEGAGGSKRGAAATKRAPARAAKLSAEEATQGIACALQGMEGAASAPKGAVAPPAKPAGVAAPIAMYLGKNGETWSGRGLKPKWVAHYLHQGGKLDDLLATKPAHASFWPFPSTPPEGKFTVGQAVRITSDTGKLRTKHEKHSGKTGTITGFDIGGKELDVKLGRDTRCFEPGELEVISA